MRVVFTGGATGGHIIPFAPIIDALRTVHSEKQATLPGGLEPKQLELFFAGVVTAAAKELFANYNVPTYHIPSGKLRRYASSLTILDLLFRLPLGIVIALIRMWLLMPDVVVSKGGYGSLPVTLAAAFYRIPVLLHESDSVPGVSNVFLSRFAAAIALGYAPAASAFKKRSKQCVTTGNPVRGQLRQLSSRDGKKIMGIPENEFVLLVFGGSQGAKQLNEALLAILPALITDTAIIHVTGPEHLQTIRTVSQELLAQSPRRQLYQVHGYLSDNMIPALVAADAVVSRAGSSLSELAAARKPALIVPLDGAAGDHQRKNAQIFEAAGAALVLDPTNMGRNLFEQNISRLRNDTELRQQLIKNIAQLDFPRAARDIAELAFSLAQGLRPT